MPAVGPAMAHGLHGPVGVYGYAPYADTVKLWWSGGYGCYTYELAVATPDGTYSSVAQLPNYVDQAWLGYQEPATTVSYVVRCASLSGLWSTWSEPFAVHDGSRPDRSALSAGSRG